VAVLTAFYAGRPPAQNKPVRGAVISVGGAFVVVAKRRAAAADG
jgi:hypothetical protein